jgi:hypothetical protein
VYVTGAALAVEAQQRDDDPPHPGTAKTSFSHDLSRSLSPLSSMKTMVRRSFWAFF